ncbi:MULTISPECIES: HD domain-containing protein [Tenebrionibacter/Tenebrionicola group]|jgi:putative hydrolase of HD superfamily|uniref:HD domain-containing protein n=2 Tax=Tenebrionibacter/Tenebrionicola group TaxID=2969848 RepID=A0A8K0V2K8_9ENTR|nr:MULTISPECIES: HD domain-containing protein [Tenebrionibacter/Tenebrionicola group]MBK4716319.1 HD domain-containing protein [Tenebrionibacter intestinalis]MBV4414522.1 HD domain-containing protein [Tenebrionicola larvae]MBV5096723.1 HD domain-containing protein [Tenebrionicola larvae]
MAEYSPTTSLFALEQVVAFLMELDKLKRVERRTRIIGNSRYENSAEHSWHFAMAALSLKPFAPAGVDITRVVKMALLHDIVEIDAGDVMVYDLAQREAISQEEALAAQRLFSILPEPQASEFLQLWREYEAADSDDARFAGAIDRVLPVLQNLHNEGKSWLENAISLEQVLTRNACVAQSLPELWRYVETQLQQAKEKGWLR